MPPAYPAPSPQGNSPAMELHPFSSRSSRTGEELRDSTPVSTPSGRSNPFSCRPNSGRAAARDSATKPGRQSHRLAGVTPGRYAKEYQSSDQILLRENLKHR